MIYLVDSYQREMEARLLERIPEGENRWRLRLDSTVFYPMGGGQPTDQGRLIWGNCSLEVYQVLIREGQVYHYAKAEEVPEEGELLTGKIDWERRYRNMRLHSAGHLIDFALYLLAISPGELTPLSADHGKRPSILYAGTTRSSLKEEVEIEANRLVKGALALSTRMVCPEELKREALYLQPNLPKNKPLRLLTLEGVGSVADGGTQVANSSEVGRIVIESVASAEGQTKISYRINP